MEAIKMNCDCGQIHIVTKDRSAPENAISMGCNWCPCCEDSAEDYFTEWYNFNNGGDENKNDPDVPDNQLMLFSIADEILQNHKIENDKVAQSKPNKTPYLYK